ncbi:MAG: leucine-rich repeat domain-containing protein, partial [Clostridia bacterium]|nr:leucine-rich repeat domain-containing protein [Clostridia bacterium]
FSGCSALTKISIPSSVKTVGEGAFSYCSSLVDVSLGGISEISRMMFHNCSSLDTITLPSTVKVVKSHAFRLCEKLTKIGLPKSVNTIEDSAFAQCDMLSTVMYEGSESDFEKIKFVLPKGDSYDESAEAMSQSKASNEPLLSATVEYKQKLK